MLSCQLLVDLLSLLKGPDAGLWEECTTNNPGPAPPLQAPITTENVQINDAIFHPSGNQAKDIAMVCNQGLDVDDDDEPSPKNIPTPLDKEPNNGLYADQSWGWDGMGWD